MSKRQLSLVAMCIVFFYKFVVFGASKVYTKYAQMPASVEEIREGKHAYRIARFQGCIGSTDATHIPLEKVSYKVWQSHLGFKLAAMTQMYNQTEYHKRQILYTTTGHPCQWNEKTRARFNDFPDELWTGGLDEKIPFAPPDHFKLSFCISTCTAHPLRELATMMVHWDRRALDAIVFLCWFLVCSTYFWRSTASVCSSCMWQHGHEIAAGIKVLTCSTRKDNDDNQDTARSLLWLAIACNLCWTSASCRSVSAASELPIWDSKLSCNFLLLPMPCYQKVVG